MAQRYTDPLAVKWLSEGKCPECGLSTYMHDGSGGPGWCALTDNGVAQRIDQYNRDKAAKRQ